MAKRVGEQAIHKPGPLKQSNKPHKHGRHRTKSQVENTHKGRVSVKNISRKTKLLGRNEKRQQAMQKRRNKVDEMLEKKRNIGRGETPPHVVAIVCLDSVCNAQTAVDVLSKSDDSVIRVDQKHGATLISLKHKQRFTVLCPNTNDISSVLICAKAADTILFLSSTDGKLEQNVGQMLTCLLAQCLPSTAVVIQGLTKVAEKKKSEVKKNIAKMLEMWLPDEKLYGLDSEMEGSILLRHIANQKQRPIFYRENRSYVLADKVEFVASSGENDGDENDKDKSVGTLKVSGFIRGQPLDVNRLVHIPGFGDFQMLQIEAPFDPYSIKKIKRGKKNEDAMATEENAEEMEEDVKLIAKANPSLQTSLDTEVIPDPMEGEQAMLDDDIAQALEERQSGKESSLGTDKGTKKKRVPKGTSEYQASWIVDSADEDDDDEEEESDDDEFVNMVESEEESEHEEDDNFDTVSLSTNIPDAKYDQELDLEEEQRHLEKYRAERENEMFPDEVDTPRDIPARVRFQRYRGLKSFRTSPWDPKENLPYDYSRIVQFENFTRMKKRFLKDDDIDGALPGWYVTIHVSNVPKEVLEHPDVLVLFGLLPHEHKMTVMHYVIKKHPSFTEPIKAKERLIFLTGYRTFYNQPVFSQHTTGSKFKSERFLPKEGVCVATVFAPVMFPPAPVLVFTEDYRLVATGTVFKADPNRIVVKKIMLSGHPYKINKKSVVVRYMFFNRDDILWFKPVELHTKYGKHGHIREPLGTHGHMKCMFDGQIHSQDTICMSLYKRVFPKWCYDPFVVSKPVMSQGTVLDEDDINMV